MDDGKFKSELRKELNGLEFYLLGVMFAATLEEIFRRFGPEHTKRLADSTIELIRVQKRLTLIPPTSKEKVH